MDENAVYLCERCENAEGVALVGNQWVCAKCAKKGDTK